MFRHLGLWSVGALAIGYGIPQIAVASDVKVYGKLIGAYAQQSTSEAELSGTRVSSSGSRFGIKASEKIDDNHEVFAKVEFGLSLTSASSTVSKRDQYLGLKTDIGSFSIGIRDTPYKKAKVDIFADTFGDHNAIISSGIERRGEQALAYMSPEIAGLQVYAQYSDAAQPGFDGSENFFSVSLTYKLAPLKVMLAHEKIARQDYQDDDDQSVSADDLTATKLTVTGKFGDASAAVVYEMIADETGDTQLDRTAYGANGTYRVGQWEGLLEYLIASESETEAGKDGATMATFAVKRHLSDQFSYYLMASNLSNDENGSYKPKAFSSDLTASGTAEESYTSAGVGMIFKF
ncbi:porin [Pseudobacteriovorax antillogorgiicola]|uniref:Outer membrane protein (Porin) n=1 Tax=Pseudobacteriovorax antillogorgiicola TaxID=1513793 RepID=A0A1Y6B7L8_9BACT|nr:porin [Pseudobacteriovorax antillogorgiicola]TCS58584.1 putative porin [Pseudobacteriovorax antillogorgiicola]SME97220.1 Outer membrane protein (porin) [Pseudobacteriovorax antillogorgiicola]